METTETAELVCVGWAFVLILSLIYAPSVWNALIWMPLSGNLFFEAIGIVGLAMAVIGFLLILYYVFVFFFLTVFIVFVFGAPAIALCQFLGMEYSMLLAAVIAVSVLLYLIETRTVRIEHHTVTVSLKRRYTIKR